MPRLFMPRLCRFRFCVASLLLLVGLSIILTARPANAAPSGLTYLGQLLVGGAPVTGSYDFQFQLYDAATGGTQVGSTVSLTSVRVADGVYYASLFFGTGVITGQTLWLQTSYRVHPSSGNPAYTTQTPRNVAPNSAFADYAQLSGSTAALQSYPLSTNAPTTGQVLQWSGSLWTPITPAAPPAYTAGTGLTLSGHQFSVATGGITNSLLASNAVTTAKISDGSVTGSKLALPLTASVSSSSDLFTLTNTGSGRAIVGNSSSNTAVKGVGHNGVYGQGTNYGVQASGTNCGVYSTSPVIGVYGTGTGSSGVGVYGQSTSSYGVKGIYGSASGSLSSGYYPAAVLGDTNVGNGVIGVTSASFGEGVIGITGANGNAGVFGLTASTSGIGVEGLGGAYGVTGNGTSYGLYGSGAYGVYGSGSSYGVYGYNSTGGASGSLGGDYGSGVYGTTTTTAPGVLGLNNAASGRAIEGDGDSGQSGNYAGIFFGNVSVIGTLSKSGGSFKIDDPIDPAHKFLSHSFVESPDMKNIYDGTVTTNANGDATITMPDWFEALNQDYRYQLTCIGQFAQAIVATEIDGNQFTIKTDKPSVKVSWQVTGTRHDAWANAHRIPVEEDKPENEQGFYLNPKEFGKPESLSILHPHPGTNALPVPPPGGAASAPKPPTQRTQQ